MYLQPPSTTRTSPFFPTPTHFRASPPVGHRRRGRWRCPAICLRPAPRLRSSRCGSSPVSLSGRCLAVFDQLPLRVMKRRNCSRPCASVAASRAASSRPEEQTSELQSLMRISYAVFCWKTKKKHNTETTYKQRIDKEYR